MKSGRRAAENNNGDMIDSVSARNLNDILGEILLENLIMIYYCFFFQRETELVRMRKCKRSSDLHKHII